MNRFIIVAVLSIPVIILSWRSLFHVKSHGFYRFLSWECIIWLAAFNYKYWFVNAFSIRQLFSWCLLIISGYFIIAGVITMKKHGKSTGTRDDKTLYKFEGTSELVDQGIFKYIRHPLYSSLLFLTWGILFKNITSDLFAIALLSSIFLYLTAKYDEKECIQFFGDKYREYMKRSSMFIPFIF